MTSNQSAGTVLGYSILNTMLEEALRERDEAREELARVRKELVAANRGAEKNAKVNQGLCSKLAEAERERDEARIEWKEAWEGWNQALDERDQSRRDLVAAEELHRRRFGSLKAEFDAACSKLAEAERKLDEAMKNTEDANRKIERMKKRYAHARKLQRVKTSVMAGVIERYYYLLSSTLDALGSSLEILEPSVKRNMPILAMYIDNLKCKEREIKEAIGAEASK